MVAGPTISKPSLHATVTVLPIEYQGWEGVVVAYAGLGCEHDAEGKNVNNKIVNSKYCILSNALTKHF